MRQMTLLGATAMLLAALAVPAFAADSQDTAQRPPEQVRPQDPKQPARDSATQSEVDAENKGRPRPFFDKWPIALLLGF